MKFTDQIGHEVELLNQPSKIISLVPSQTELLFDLGLTDKVVGITKFCVHPDEWFHSKTRVGGTKNLNIDKIKLLQPDLIIANKEENTKEQILELQKEFNVWTSNVFNLNSAINMITSIGKLINKADESKLIINSISKEFGLLASIKKQQKSVLYLIWKEPYMSVGNNTFIGDMLKKCGIENVLINDLNYPTVTEEQIKLLQPDFIFLSSEPYPFNESKLNEMEMKFPRSKLFLVDGELFSWYGSRLRYSPRYFIDLLNKMA